MSGDQGQSYEGYSSTTPTDGHQRSTNNGSSAGDLTASGACATPATITFDEEDVERFLKQYEGTNLSEGELMALYISMLWERQQEQGYSDPNILTKDSTIVQGPRSVKLEWSSSLSKESISQHTDHARSENNVLQQSTPSVAAVSGNSLNTNRTSCDSVLLATTSTDEPSSGSAYSIRESLTALSYAGIDIDAFLQQYEGKGYTEDQLMGLYLTEVAQLEKQAADTPSVKKTSALSDGAAQDDLALLPSLGQPSMQTDPSNNQMDQHYLISTTTVSTASILEDQVNRLPSSEMSHQQRTDDSSTADMQDVASNNPQLHSKLTTARTASSKDDMVPERKGQPSVVEPLAIQSSSANMTTECQPPTITFNEDDVAAFFHRYGDKDLSEEEMMALYLSMVLKKQQEQGIDDPNFLTSHNTLVIGPEAASSKVPPNSSRSKQKSRHEEPEDSIRDGERCSPDDYAQSASPTSSTSSDAQSVVTLSEGSSQGSNPSWANVKDDDINEGIIERLIDTDTEHTEMLPTDNLSTQEINANVSEALNEPDVNDDTNRSACLFESANNADFQSNVHELNNRERCSDAVNASQEVLPSNGDLHYSEGSTGTSGHTDNSHEGVTENLQDGGTSHEDIEDKASEFSTDSSAYLTRTTEEVLKEYFAAPSSSDPGYVAVKFALHSVYTGVRLLWNSWLKS